MPGVAPDTRDKGATAITTVKVSTAAELLDALASADDIHVDGSLSGIPMISLPPGVRLRGGTLRFGAKGVRGA
jgi:hypothetical protein